MSEVRRLNEPQVDLYAWISDFTSGCAGIAAGIGTACDNNEHRKVSVTAGPSRANAVVETAEVRNGEKYNAVIFCFLQAS